MFTMRDGSGRDREDGIIPTGALNFLPRRDMIRRYSAIFCRACAREIEKGGAVELRVLLDV